MYNFEITTQFTGGNVRVTGCDGDTVFLTPDLRDTQGEWFYWAFCVKNAGGRKLKFCFDNEWVGPWGASVSHDLKKWEWQGVGEESSFEYSFATDENCVYFAHHMLYHPSRFLSFANEHGLEVKTLCTSEKGRAVPCIEFGGGNTHVILTARHHACESTGNYVLEGVIDRLLEKYQDDYRVLCVPFVDYDGVLDGDQGKNRYPHDHNRDYIEKPLYSTVKAIMEYAEANDVLYGFDFHSPWHRYGGNDNMFIVLKIHKKMQQLVHFGKFFERCMNADAFEYRLENDFTPDKDWSIINTTGMGAYILDRSDKSIGFTLETAYFGKKGNAFEEKRVIESGRCFADAFAMFAEERKQ